MAHQLFVPTFDTKSVLAQIKECLDKGWTGAGFKTDQFEKSWGLYSGHKHSLFLNSCTAALHLALESLRSYYNWSDDDEVIVPGITFVSTAHAVLHAGLKLRISDVNVTSVNISVEHIAPLINSRTLCIVFVGLGGNIEGLPEVDEFCASNGLQLVVDAAHMAGSRQSETCIDPSKPPNSNIAFTCFSFQAVKNLPTGDSGMLCSDREELIDIARKLSWLGIDKDTYSRINDRGTYKWEYDVANLGYKYNGNSIMAAIALAQLPYLDRDNAYRRTLFDWYSQCLHGSQIRMIKHSNQSQTSQHLIQARLKNRNEVMVALNTHEIYPGVHYKSLKYFTFFRDHQDQSPNANSLSKELVSLPCHMHVTRADVEFISSALLQACSRWTND